MPTHILGLSWNRGTDSISQTVSLTADGEHNYDITVPASTTNKQVDCVLDVSELKSIYIKSDVAVTIKTNSTGSPDNTFSIAASSPFVWYYGSGITNPIGTDVTVLYITNATSGAATVYLRFIEDDTP